MDATDGRLPSAPSTARATRCSWRSPIIPGTEASSLPGRRRFFNEYCARAVWKKRKDRKAAHRGINVNIAAVELAFFLRRQVRQNLKLLTIYSVFLLTMILGYAYLFRYLMWDLEGREYSLMAGIYWVITVMTTLGFGDITFHTDSGFLFATIVTLSGVVFLLVLLPFILISLFIAPRIEQSMRYRPKRELPAETRGHVLIFGLDDVTRAFLQKLEGWQIPFVVVTADADEAFRLESEGIRVLWGTPTDGEFLEKARVGAARCIVTNLNDPESVNLCLTARELGDTPIAVIADESGHADLLRLAGATHVIPLPQILGRHMATRATTFGATAHALDSFGSLLIAEMPVYGTPFAGQSLGQVRLRERTGLSVIGILERGSFAAPRMDSVLSAHTLVLLAGTREQMAELERLVRVDPVEDMVFILGHGRIGCAVATVLGKMNVPFTLIDKKDNLHCGDHETVRGDATRLDLLRKAGINNARGLIITTNDDNANIFLALASRHANSHVRIVARANREENVDELYAAGADFVVSNASVGANFLANVVEKKASIFLTEGVNVFRRPLPPRLTGWSIAESNIGATTGCVVVALIRPDVPEPLVTPPPETVLEAGMEIVLIGNAEQEQRFKQEFS